MKNEKKKMKNSDSNSEQGISLLIDENDEQAIHVIVDKTKGASIVGLFLEPSLPGWLAETSVPVLDHELEIESLVLVR